MAGINTNTNVPFKTFIVYLLIGAPLYVIGCLSDAIIFVKFYNSLTSYWILILLYAVMALFGGFLFAKGFSEWKKIDSLENTKMELQNKKLELENQKLELEIKKLKSKK